MSSKTEAFHPILLTEERDRLVLHPQAKLRNELGGDVDPQLNFPNDLDALELGKYPVASMRPRTSGVIGGDRVMRTNDILGHHDICGGLLEIFTTSSTHRTITCAQCRTTVKIPISIKTYGDLRRHAEETLFRRPKAEHKHRR